MGSIYRKGRDGYFYYQTYIKNPKTGKKDKKIFHSLGTKDESEANKKKVELDNQYENNVKGVRLKYMLGNKLVPLIVILVLFLINLFDYFRTNSENSDIINKKIISRNKDSSDIVGQITYEIDADSYKKVIEEVEIDDNINFKTQKDSSVNKIIIPNYTVISKEQLSGVFNQGKINIIIDTYDKNINLEPLCKKIANENQEYANVVICVYDNSEIGREIALGIKSNFSEKDLKNAWLAMYSYNDVEGPYFNNDPAGHRSNN